MKGNCEFLNEFRSFTYVYSNIYQRIPKRTSFLKNKKQQPWVKPENGRKYSDWSFISTPWPSALNKTRPVWLLFIHLLTQVGPCLYKPQHEVGRVRPVVNRRQIHLLLLPLQHVGSNLSLAELLHSFSVQQQHGRLLLRPLGLRFFQGPSNLRVSDTKAQIKAKRPLKAELRELPSPG